MYYHFNQPAMFIEQQTLSARVYSMLDEGQMRTDIESFLLEKGLDIKYVKELISETSKLRDSKRRAQGLMLILGGVLICFLSFLLTITSSFSNNTFPYVLYGVTSLGIVIVFTGLTKVF